MLRTVPQSVAGLLSLLLFLASAVQSRGARQTDPETPESSIQPSTYSVTTWTTGDGLPANHVGHIMQTSDGYLWLASAGGLVRFDGTGFDVFGREYFEGWQTGYVSSLHEDGATNLWIVSRMGELACYCNGQFESWPALRIGKLHEKRNGALWFSTQKGLARVGDGTVTLRPLAGKAIDDSLPSASINDVHHDRSGRVWVGTSSGLLRMDDEPSRVYTREDGLPSSEVLKIHEDRQDQLWVLTANGLARWEGERFTAHAQNHHFSHPVRDTYVDPNGALWMLSASKLLRLQDGALRTYAVDPLDDAEYNWAMTPDGTLWIGHRRGLMRVQNGQAIPVGRDAGITTNVSALQVDRQGVLWIGMRGQGVLRLQPGRSTPRSFSEVPEMEAVPSLFEDAEGNVWIGSDAGLHRATRRKFASYTEREGLAEAFTFAVHGGQNGAMWLGTWGGGFHRIQDGRLTRYTMADGLPSNYIRALHEDRSGRLWIGTAKGLCRLDEGRAVAIPGYDRWVRAILEDRTGTLRVGGNGFLMRMTDQGLVRDTTRAFGTVWALHEDRHGRLWVGTERGLFQKAGDRWTHFTTADGLSSNFVVSIHEEEDGTLWFGTRGGGLNRLEDEKFVVYTAADGLHSDGVWGILEDHRENFWMSSDKGLFRVSERELDAFAAGEIHRVTSIAYDEADGLPSAEFNRGDPAAWKDQSGRLWFPTIKGAVVVDPDAIPKNERPPPVHIEEVVVNGRPVSPQDDSALGPESENLEFHYTALSLTAPETNQYQYKLDGYDKNWVEAGTRRTAFYTNLPPGAYTFRVRAANNDGVWNEAGASFTFRLQPFFYETIWFRLLCIAGLLVVLTGGYHLRIKYLREQELEAQVAARTRELEGEKATTEAQARKLKKRARRLRELDRLKSRFFANISHEFRTPLSMILGPIRDVLDRGKDALALKERTHLQMAARNAQRMKRLVDQLLDLATLEAGVEKLQRRQGDLVAFVREEVRAHAPLAERKRIRLDFRSEPDCLEAAFDSDKLAAILRNLLSNALKFTPDGGTIRVRLTDEGDQAVLRVRDNGPGIPEEKLPHVFDRFYQGDDSTTREHEGAGIGLSIVKDFVELHGGSIEVESELDFGTEFVVRLPTAVEPDEDRHVEREEGADAAEPPVPEGRGLEPLPEVHEENAFPPTATGGGETPTVLIVEDHADVRGYLRHILVDSYRVIEAENGLEALDRIREERPDLVLSDIMMPKMDGLELCRTLKQNEEFQSLPVVLLTARVDEVDQIEGLDVGADDYITKPFDADALTSRIQNLIARHRSLRAQFSREVVVQPKAVRITSDEEAFLNAAHEVVEAHISDKHFTVEAFAGEMDLSRSQLTRKLKKISKFTPGDFIRELRLKRAAQLIKQGAGGVAQVARRVGYADADHFSQLFRERFGVPPSEYPPTNDA